MCKMYTVYEKNIVKQPLFGFVIFEDVLNYQISAFVDYTEEKVLY